MNSHVLKPGALTDAAPGSLQIGEVRGRQLAGDDPEIVLLAGQGGQHGAVTVTGWCQLRVASSFLL